MKKKRGFTLFELLGVIVILSIISAIAVASITSYSKKGKDEYDKTLEKTFLTSAKSFFSTESSFLPKNVGDSTVVTLGELLSKNYLSSSLKTSADIECSNDSKVMITKKSSGYDYNVCLMCGDEQDSTNCYVSKAKHCDHDSSKLYVDGKTVSATEYKDAGCTICDKDSNDSYILKNFYSLDYLNNSCNTNVVRCDKDSNGKYHDSNGNIVNKDEYESDEICFPVLPSDDSPVPCSYSREGFYYDAHGNKVNESEYKASCTCKAYPSLSAFYDNHGNSVSESKYKKSCIIENVSCSSKLHSSLSSPSKYSFYDTNSSSCGSDSIVKSFSKLCSNSKWTSYNSRTVNSSAKTFCSYYVNTTSLNSMCLKKLGNAVDVVPDGSAAKGNDYYSSSIRSGASSLKGSSYTSSNTTIPSIYTFRLNGSADSVTYTTSGCTKMSGSQISSWYSGSSSSKELIIRENATKNVACAIDNLTSYSAYYKNVGTYNGKNIDVSMTLSGHSNSNTTKKRGIVFHPAGPQVVSYGLRKVGVVYKFYDNATGKEISVKGYTTFWDIDALQGIHFLSGANQLFYGNGSVLKVKKVNGSPYVFSTDSSDYNNGYDNRGVVAETFSGTSMKNVYTYNIYGTVKHSGVPIGADLLYNSTSFNEDSTYRPNNAVGTYKIVFGNSDSNKQNFKIKVDISNGSLRNSAYSTSHSKALVVHYNGESKDVKPTSINSSGFTFEASSMKPDTSGYLLFKVVPNTAVNNGCGKIVSVKATYLTNGKEYTTDELINPIICYDYCSN